MSGYLRCLLSGAAGAVTLTAIHELVRRRVDYAPRMDLVATRGLRQVLPDEAVTKLGVAGLRRLALIGDLVSNSLYYAAIPAGTAAATWRRAMTLGAVAGAGALVLPEPLGLGSPPNSDVRANQLMTLAWYLGGAIAAGAVANIFGGAERRQTRHPA
jgi:hypothetical protein